MAAIASSANPISRISDRFEVVVNVESVQADMRSTRPSILRDMRIRFAAAEAEPVRQSVAS